MILTQCIVEVSGFVGDLEFTDYKIVKVENLESVMQAILELYSKREYTAEIHKIEILDWDIISIVQAISESNQL